MQYKALTPLHLDQGCSNTYYREDAIQSNHTTTPRQGVQQYILQRGCNTKQSHHYTQTRGAAIHITERMQYKAITPLHLDQGCSNTYYIEDAIQSNHTTTPRLGVQQYILQRGCNTKQSHDYTQTRGAAIHITQRMQYKAITPLHLDQGCSNTYYREDAIQSNHTTTPRLGVQQYILHRGCNTKQSHHYTQTRGAAIHITERMQYKAITPLHLDKGCSNTYYIEDAIQSNHTTTPRLGVQQYILQRGCNTSQTTPRQGVQQYILQRGCNTKQSHHYTQTRGAAIHITERMQYKSITRLHLDKGCSNTYYIEDAIQSNHTTTPRLGVQQYILQRGCNTKQSHDYTQTRGAAIHITERMQYKAITPLHLDQGCSNTYYREDAIQSNHTTTPRQGVQQYILHRGCNTKQSHHYTQTRGAAIHITERMQYKAITPLHLDKGCSNTYYIEDAIQSNHTTTPRLGVQQYILQRGCNTNQSHDYTQTGGAAIHITERMQYKAITPLHLDQGCSNTYYKEDAIQSNHTTTPRLGVQQYILQRGCNTKQSHDYTQTGGAAIHITERMQYKAITPLHLDQGCSNTYYREDAIQINHTLHLDQGCSNTYYREDAIQSNHMTTPRLGVQQYILQRGCNTKQSHHYTQTRGAAIHITERMQYKAITPLHLDQGCSNTYYREDAIQSNHTTTPRLGVQQYILQRGCNTKQSHHYTQTGGAAIHITERMQYKAITPLHLDQGCSNTYYREDAIQSNHTTTPRLGVQQYILQRGCNTNQSHDYTQTRGAAIHITQRMQYKAITPLHLDQGCSNTYYREDAIQINHTTTPRQGVQQYILHRGCNTKQSHHYTQTRGAAIHITERMQYKSITRLHLDKGCSNTYYIEDAIQSNHTTTPRLGVQQYILQRGCNTKQSHHYTQTRGAAIHITQRMQYKAITPLHLDQGCSNTYYREDAIQINHTTTPKLGVQQYILQRGCNTKQSHHYTQTRGAAIHITKRMQYKAITRLHLDQVCSNTYYREDAIQSNHMTTPRLGVQQYILQRGCNTKQSHHYTQTRGAAIHITERMQYKSITHYTQTRGAAIHITERMQYKAITDYTQTGGAAIHITERMQYKAITPLHLDQGCSNTYYREDAIQSNHTTTPRLGVQQYILQRGCNTKQSHHYTQTGGAAIHITERMQYKSITPLHLDWGCSNTYYREDAIQSNHTTTPRLGVQQYILQRGCNTKQSHDYTQTGGAAIHITERMQYKAITPLHLDQGCSNTYYREDAIQSNHTTTPRLGVQQYILQRGCNTKQSHDYTQTGGAAIHITERMQYKALTPLHLDQGCSNTYYREDAIQSNHTTTPRLGVQQYILQRGCNTKQSHDYTQTRGAAIHITERMQYKAITDYTQTRGAAIHITERMQYKSITPLHLDQGCSNTYYREDAIQSNHTTTPRLGVQQYILQRGCNTKQSHHYTQTGGAAIHITERMQYKAITPLHLDWGCSNTYYREDAIQSNHTTTPRLGVQQYILQRGCNTKQSHDYTQTGGAAIHITERMQYKAITPLHLDQGCSNTYYREDAIQSNHTTTPRLGVQQYILQRGCNTKQSHDYTQTGGAAIHITERMQYKSITPLHLDQGCSNTYYREDAIQSNHTTTPRLGVQQYILQRGCNTKQSHHYTQTRGAAIHITERMQYKSITPLHLDQGCSNTYYREDAIQRDYTQTGGAAYYRGCNTKHHTLHLDQGCSNTYYREDAIQSNHTTTPRLGVQQYILQRGCNTKQSHDYTQTGGEAIHIKERMQYKSIIPLHLDQGCSNTYYREDAIQINHTTTPRLGVQQYILQRGCNTKQSHHYTQTRGAAIHITERMQYKSITPLHLDQGCSNTYYREDAIQSNHMTTPRLGVQQYILQRGCNTKQSHDYTQTRGAAIHITERMQYKSITPLHLDQGCSNTYYREDAIQINHTTTPRLGVQQYILQRGCNTNQSHHYTQTRGAAIHITERMQYKSITRLHLDQGCSNTYYREDAIQINHTTTPRLGVQQYILQRGCNTNQSHDYTQTRGAAIHITERMQYKAITRLHLDWGCSNTYYREDAIQINHTTTPRLGVQQYILQRGCNTNQSHDYTQTRGAAIHITERIQYKAITPLHHTQTGGAAIHITKRMQYNFSNHTTAPRLGVQQYIEPSMRRDSRHNDSILSIAFLIYMCRYYH